MSLRPWAEVSTALPMDGIEGEVDGSWDFIEFPGRSVTEAIGAMLVPLGYDVSTPKHSGEQGWELEICAGGRRFWLQITRMEERICNLIAFDVTWHFWRKRPSFREFLTQLDATLRADSRFSDIGWHTGREDETRTPHPVVAD